MGRRGGLVALFSTSWMPYAVIAVGIVAIYYFRRGKKNRGGAARGAAAAAAAAASKGRSNKSLAERIADGEHREWPIVVTTDALWPTPATVPLAAADRVDLDALKRLVSVARSGLVLVHRLSDEDERRAVLAWAKEHLVPLGFERHQLIFCTTEKGVEAVARQLEAKLFVSRSRTLCEFLSKFFPYTAVVEPTPPPTSPAAVMSVPRLSSLPL